MSDHLEQLRDQLTSVADKARLLRSRKSEYFAKSVKHALAEECIQDGWEFVSELKTKTKLQKRKTKDVYFEDGVWKLFADLGFIYLNKDRTFKVPYSNDPSLTQQIDVFASDDEVAILVECKAAINGPTKSYFKKDIEALGGRKAGLIAQTKKLLGNDNLKVVFVFATFDYILSEVDKERLENFGIQHFDNDKFDYYQELAKMLGTATRYQLEANLFLKQTIPALENKVPAIRGKMGGHTYFSFNIEPEKLLKIGYILHRSKANKKLMPTYQRIIKTARLRSVRKFVKEGGFFPNSIIVNIDAKKTPKFDLAANQAPNAISKIGILHLPKQYRSLFIIDGQHRLYGYSNSDYAKSNSIPVVAFVNLEREDQVRIFMEINENQKAVSKNLRHTLNADLLWESEDMRQRINALKLQIAQDIGEDLSSPLYNRIIVGENARTETRNITLDPVKQGLDRSNFFGEFTKLSIKKDGTFYKGGNEETYDALFPFLTKMFSHVRENCLEEWNRSSKEDGLILINMGINSLLRIFSDIVDHLINQAQINPKSDPTDFLIEKCSYYLDPLRDFYSDIEPEQRIKIKRAYGSGGPTRYWRVLQKAIVDARPDFNPEGFEEFWAEESKAFNTQSFEMIREIEHHLNIDFKDKLEAYYGDQWFKKGVHPDVYKSSTSSAADKNKNIFDPKEEKDPWEDCLFITDYQKIALYGSNWLGIFEKSYTRPGEEKIQGGGKAKTKWLDKVNRIRNENFHEYSVKTDEFELLKEIYDWLIAEQ